MVLNDLDFVAVASGTGGAGVAGNLVFQADGIVRIGGSVTLSGAVNNCLTIRATEAMSLDALTGRLAVTNGGILGGSLFLDAPDIYALTDAAFDDIQGLEVSQIDTRLAQSDNGTNTDGFFAASTIGLSFTGDLLVQNTAGGIDFGDRRGFVVGDGGLKLNPGASTSRIVINGIVASSDGTATGIDVIPLTTIDGAFDALSTINGCVILNVASCMATPPPAPSPPPATTPPPAPTPPPTATPSADTCSDTAASAGAARSHR